MPSTGTLFVVATPIGNLEDITLRALRVLREAQVIAAEDTRRTAKLLAHHGIPTPTVSFHAHNVRTRMPRLLERLRGGAQVALVSDAGTPGISDPGVEIVQECLEQGIPVDPVPGASAPLAAAVGSGFPIVPLTICGFAPPRAKDRTAFISSLKDYSHTCVFFEAPTRIAATLSLAADLLGERPIVVARELTKVHQEFVRGTAASLAGRFEHPRGEFTIVIGPAIAVHREGAVPSDAEMAAEFGRITESGSLTRREAIGSVAESFGLAVREVYAAIERHKAARHSG